MLVILLGLSLAQGRQQCSHPQGEDGSQMTEGCLVLTCQGGAWRASLTTTQCCFEGETYPTNTTITSTMSQDKCVKADVVCVGGEDDKAKTVLKMENYCEPKNKNTGCQEKITEPEHPNCLTVSCDGVELDSRGKRMCLGYQTFRMGTYKMSNKKHNGQPVWVNMDRSQKLFSTQNGTWMIGNKVTWNEPLDYYDNIVGIRSAEQGQATVPTTGWQFLLGGTSWHSEANLTVTPGEPVYPQGLTVSSTSEYGAIRAFPTMMGEYCQVKDKKMDGRPVWKHTEHNHWFFRDGHTWVVGSKSKTGRIFSETGFVGIPSRGWEYGDSYYGGKEDRWLTVKESKCQEKEKTEPFPDILTVRSDGGPASVSKPYMMGTYKKSNKEFNGHPIWIHKDPVQNQELFYTSDKYWIIYHQHGNIYGYGAIKSVEAGLDYVPTHGWQYDDPSNSGLIEDEHLTVSGGETVYPQGVTVASEGPSGEKHSSRMGEFYQSSFPSKWNGRPLWKNSDNEDEDVWLYFTGKYWNIGPDYHNTRAWMSHPKEGLVGIPAEGWQYADDDDKTKTWLDDIQLTVREIEVKECTQQIYMGVIPYETTEKEHDYPDILRDFK